MSTITSANSVFTMTATGLFPVPVQIQGFAMDKAFLVENADRSETKMGVDGKLSFGYVFTERPVTISLQADSASRDFFSILDQATKTAREVIVVNGTLTLPSTGESFTLNRGVLKSMKEFPDAQKTLQSVDYMLTFESIDRAVL